MIIDIRVKINMVVKCQNRRFGVLKPAGIRRRYTCYLPAIMLETMVQDDIGWHESVDIFKEKLCFRPIIYNIELLLNKEVLIASTSRN